MARHRALAAARAVTLGLAIAGSASGCERGLASAGDVYCDVFSQGRFCCERRGGHWDGHTCQVLVVPGPFVPPDQPRVST